METSEFIKKAIKTNQVIVELRSLENLLLEIEFSKLTTHAKNQLKEVLNKEKERLNKELTELKEE